MNAQIRSVLLTGRVLAHRPPLPFARFFANGPEVSATVKAASSGRGSIKQLTGMLQDLAPQSLLARMLHPRGMSLNVSKVLYKTKGIGWATAYEIMSLMQMHPHIRVKDLSKEQALMLSRIVSEKYMTGRDVSSKMETDIMRYVRNGSTRGQRHLRGLPVRGQRTHTNAKTAKKLNKRRVVSASNR
eukprot:GABV01009935.1.p1 GENE.GABV01009935.1~~GABV01009935.1.p1  ORF type:complete len:186 (-),score=1.54 GABV01009935.1:8-565(-)